MIRGLVHGQHQKERDNKTEQTTRVADMMEENLLISKEYSRSANLSANQNIESANRILKDSNWWCLHRHKHLWDSRRLISRWVSWILLYLIRRYRIGNPIQDRIFLAEGSKRCSLTKERLLLVGANRLTRVWAPLLIVIQLMIAKKITTAHQDKVHTYSFRIFPYDLDPNIRTTRWQPVFRVLTTTTI